MTPIDADLGQLADVIRGITFPTDAKRRQPGPGLVACLRTTNVQGSVDWDDLLYVDENHVKSSDQFVRNGDILVSMSNSLELVGKCALVTDVPQRAAFGAFIAVVRVRDGVNPTYVFHAMRSPRFRAYVREAASTTTNISNINASKLIAAQIPLFGPATCTSIASKLDELFSRIDEGERALERVQKLVERYRQSVLKAAVTGELTRDWREKNKTKLESGEALRARILKARREAWETAELDKMKAKGITPANDKWKQKYEEPMAPNTDGLPELPEGWVWASVDQVSLNLDGKRIPLKAADRDKRSGPYPYYGAQGVIDDIDDFLFDGDFLLVAEDGENLRSRIKPLAFNASGKFWVNNHAHILSPVPGIHRDFLRAAINSLNISRSVTGTAQPKLTQAALSKLAVPITSDQEQRAVVALLDAATNNSNAATAPVASELRRAAGLRQSILKSAFSGALVDHDPTDEPAAVLLKRISADGTAAPAKPQRGRKPKTQESA